MSKASKKKKAAVSPLLRSRLRKAETLRDAGRLQESESLLQTLCQKNPNLLEGWLLLASIQGMSGAYDKVAASCHHILQFSPSHPSALSLLGSASIAMGRFDDGIHSLTEAVKLVPNDPGILTNLASALYTTGKPTEAEGYYLSALKILPGNPRVLFGLGNCSLALGKYKKAVTSFTQAYNNNPNDYDVAMSLGKSLVNIGALDEAYEYLLKASKLTAAPTVAECEMARVCEFQGRLEQALQHIDKAVTLQPDNYEALAMRAQVNFKLGNIDQACQQIAEVVAKVEEPSYSIVLSWGDLCKKCGDCEAVLNHALRLINDNNVPMGDKTLLHYLLGRLYEKQADYGKAFSHYSNANTLLPLQPFNQDEHKRVIDGSISAYSPDTFAGLSRSTSSDKRPVFIVGMPRSGTSLVEQILASHPDVYGAGELPHIKIIASDISQGNDFSEQLKALTSERLDAAAARYLSLIEEDAGDAKHITDKMPDNFLFLGFIALLFPNARIIHCIRDPRDTCLSIFFQSFSQSHPYAHSLNDIAFYYRCYEKIMDHWKESLGLPVLDIHYEKLVEDQEKFTRDMLDYLDLPWNDACLSFHQSKRVAATASWDQVRQPIYKSSSGRWQKFREFIPELISEFGDGELVK